MPFRDSDRLREWRRRQLERQREFIRRVRARAVCQGCGVRGPVEFHNPDHYHHPRRRVSKLGGRTVSLEYIKAEMRRCRMLCPACHDEAEREVRAAEYAGFEIPP